MIFLKGKRRSKMGLDITYEKANKNGKVKRIVVREITDAEYAIATSQARPVNVDGIAVVAHAIHTLRLEEVKKQKAIAKAEAKLAKLKGEGNG